MSLFKARELTRPILRNIFRLRALTMLYIISITH
ncbi:protein of unknown function (plasmid) [Pararobbsia alpina]